MNLLLFLEDILIIKCFFLKKQAFIKPPDIYEKKEKILLFKKPFFHITIKKFDFFLSIISIYDHIFFEFYNFFMFCKFNISVIFECKVLKNRSNILKCESPFEIKQNYLRGECKCFLKRSSK